MTRRQRSRKRRRDDDDDDDEDEGDKRPSKRGKEEADEDDADSDDDIFGYGATDPQAGEPWTAEQDQRLITLRTYVHRSGLKLSWTHVAERFPKRTKQALKHRWRQIASEQQRQEHVLKKHGEHKTWDEEQDEQLRTLKRQGLTHKDIASRMGRSVYSVGYRWTQIADDGEKQRHVRFSEVEDRLLVRLSKKRSRLPWRQIARSFPGRTVPTLQNRLSALQHSANKRSGKWTRGEQVLVKTYVAAGAKATLIAKRLGTRTPNQVAKYISEHKSSMATSWRALEDARLRNAVAAAKRLGKGGDDERAWTKETWRWVARYVGRGWFDCLARADMLHPKAGEWTRAKLVELARIMLLPAGERAADYHVAFNRTKRQCLNKWHSLKRRNPTLLASVVAETTGEGSSSAAAISSSSSTAAASSRSTAGEAAVAKLGPRARLLYALSRRQ